jgi:hypothetical protein
VPDLKQEPRPYTPKSLDAVLAELDAAVDKAMGDLDKAVDAELGK